MKFKELSVKTQRKVTLDYLLGWQETHPIGEDPIGDLTFEEAFECCIDTNDEVEYDIYGNEIEEEENE